MDGTVSLRRPRLRRSLGGLLSVVRLSRRLFPRLGLGTTFLDDLTTTFLDQPLQGRSLAVVDGMAEILGTAA
jgi:hypothetical protein